MGRSTDGSALRSKEGALNDTATRTAQEFRERYGTADVLDSDLSLVGTNSASDAKFQQDLPRHQRFHTLVHGRGRRMNTGLFRGSLMVVEAEPRTKALVALLASFAEADADEQRETFAALASSLDEERSPGRTLYS